ncbi:alpha/beta hydrolase [Phanerochaete sordida]|uniref:Alpha/beta hydrolase n=1 Tax=Phanerochaete sordida TaxID=48140 RepID=A0A9P3LJA1_9APHY|nr:alpha/beta hydrolase [Phanerochaete sordida]
MGVRTSLALSTVVLATAVSAQFDWSSLNSSTKLSWTPCFDTFQCARFSVPLQYSNASAGEAQIALVMSPSSYSRDDPNYQGAILFNPGGPGNSGVNFVLSLQPYFRAIIGPGYDLVGFDPRAVGVTTPVLSVFKSPPEALEAFATFPLNTDDAPSSLGRQYAVTQIVNDVVRDRAPLIAESIGTAAIATDMLQIARAFGQEKVNYWGISYGSILGSTFAAMFPNNVGRFVIDGVGDAHQYYYGLGTTDPNSLLHTDAALTSIYDACVAAGPTLCPIWQNSTALVRARVNRLLDEVHLAPVPLYNASDPVTPFGILDYATVFEAVFQMIYFPYSTGTSTAAALVALEQGNGVPLYTGSTASAIDIVGGTCAPPPGPFVVGFTELIASITCGDAVVDKRRTLAQTRADYAVTRRTSPFAAAWWAPLFGTCATFSLKAKDRFNGSFETSTSEPILFISNTLDPVTPIDSGRNMSAGFKGSVLLQQNSTGHTSLSGFSTCTALAIRAYFQHGTLPKKGTICQPDTRIFDTPTNSSGFGGVSIFTRSEENMGLSDAARIVHKAAPFLSRAWRPRWT